MHFVIIYEWNHLIRVIFVVLLLLVVSGAAGVSGAAVVVRFLL